MHVSMIRYNASHFVISNKARSHERNLIQIRPTRLIMLNSIDAMDVGKCLRIKCWPQKYGHKLDVSTDGI